MDVADLLLVGQPSQGAIDPAVIDFDLAVGETIASDGSPLGLGISCQLEHQGAEEQDGRYTARHRDSPLARVDREHPSP